ncbi:MAG: DUF2975 domain-containing protein [Rubrivivax sp.]
MGQSPPRVAVGSIALSRLLAVACLILSVALPLLSLYALSGLSAEAWFSRVGLRSLAPTAPWQVGAAFGLALLPVSAMAYGLLRASQCLRGFVRGEVFDVSTVKHLRGFAAAALVSALLGLAVPMLISLVLTWHAPPGQHALAMGVSASDLLMALVAGIVWQVAAVFTRAIALAEENAQFI